LKILLTPFPQKRETRRKRKLVLNSKFQSKGKDIPVILYPPQHRKERGTIEHKAMKTGNTE